MVIMWQLQRLFMNLKTLGKAIASIESVTPFRDYIIGLAKPCVRIHLTGESAKDSGSRFGGHPFLPSDFQWPQHGVGEYRFLGQINFSEITDRPRILPESGLLSIFYAFDKEGEIFWGDEGYVLGFYWPNFDNYSMFDSPITNPPGSIGVNLNGGIDIPRNEYLREDWPFDSDALNELIDALDENNEYLLGYPSFMSLAYDPTPEGDWISFLTVHSLDALDWCWHDGDKLMVFIEASKLAKCDFGNLKSDAG